MVYLELIKLYLIVTWLWPNNKMLHKSLLSNCRGFINLQSYNSHRNNIYRLTTLYFETNEKLLKKVICNFTINKCLIKVFYKAFYCLQWNNHYVPKVKLFYKTVFRKAFVKDNATSGKVRVI